MIPRLKPFLGWDEFMALFEHHPDSVERFEVAFAKALGTHSAVAFPYGRSALWAFLKALNIEQSEVILPAYTCSVVAHAVVLSSNIPRFVDITLTDYNMDLDAVANAVNERTRVIIATHLFGYPLNINRLRDIVSQAEERFGHKIWVVQDCAHSFGAEWEGEPVQRAADVALFGSNISKTMTSIFGGQLATDDQSLASTLREWRDAHFHRAGAAKGLRRRLYLLAIYPAFNESLYGLVYWLQNGTPLLKGLTDAYHLDEKVHFPPDYQDFMLPVEAQVGQVQIAKYSEIIRKRKENAEFYHRSLIELSCDDFVLPPLVAGATYSHYVIRVANRQQWVEKAAPAGVQLGILIEYSVPELHAYRQYRGGQDFPNARLCSEHMINLPVYAGLKAVQRERVVAALRQGQQR
jgi:perosamine synthetase